MKKLIILLIPAFGLAQYTGHVGINLTTPSATLHVNGNVKLKASQGLPTDSILVIRNNEVLKIASSSLTQGKCPSFKYAQSNGYSLVFTSTESIPNPNNNLTIEGKNFVSAGAYINSNLYYFQYSNTTGQPININIFTVNFSGLICNY